MEVFRRGAESLKLFHHHLSGRASSLERESSLAVRGCVALSLSMFLADALLGK